MESSSHAQSKPIIRRESRNLCYEETPVAGVILQTHSAKIFHFIHVALFGIFGCLTRVITNYIFGFFFQLEDADEVVNRAFISNMAGCFVLGALHGSPMNKTNLKSLFTGLTFGFCGGITTWSKWNQQLSLALIGETDTISQNQVLGFVAIFIGFYAFMGSYVVGRDFGKRAGLIMGKTVIKNGSKISDVAATIILITTVFLQIIVSVLKSGYVIKKITMALLFSPVASCISYYVSSFRFRKFKKIPFGTFAVNVFGAVLFAGLHVLQSRVRFESCAPFVACLPDAWLFAAGVGFCDTLTTVSWFMAEIYKLRRHGLVYYSYCYFILTLVFSQIFCGIINGINYTIS